MINTTIKPIFRLQPDGSYVVTVASRRVGIVGRDDNGWWGKASLDESSRKPGGATFFSANFYQNSLRSRKAAAQAIIDFVAILQ
jgi:hypothetical protein